MDVLHELEQLAPVAGVFGNNDEPALVELLPERRVVELEGVRLGMVHDAGRRAGRAGRLAGQFPGCDAVVYAHSHVPEATCEGGFWLLNPGSPTDRRRAPARSMLELTLNAGEIRPRVVTFSS